MRIIAIGLSRFGIDSRRSLPFAASDAKRFAERVRFRGPTTAVTDSDATIAAVTAAVQELANDPSGGCIFLVSHATHREGDVQISLHDGVISLAELLQPTWKRASGRLSVFLDLMRDGTPAERPTAEDIAAILPQRPDRALVLSDDGRHGSFVSGDLQAGVWAHLVTDAMAGRAASAHTAAGIVTPASLRSFLRAEVPRSLAVAYRAGRQQSPQVFAADDDLSIVAAAAEESPPAADAELPPLFGVRFVSVQEVPVKALGGFRKSVHSVPGDTLASSRGWVARLAEPDLARDLEETVARLREHLRYKRREVRVDGPTDGAASILTPDFAYHLTARQHDSKPDRAVLGRSLAEITNAAIFSREELAAAFPAGFLSLVQPFDRPADVARLIDRLEDDEPRAVVKLNYPTDLAYCTIELRGFDGEVRIDREGLTVSGSGPLPPAALAEQFALARRILQQCGE